MTLFYYDSAKSTNHRIDHNNHSNNHLPWKENWEISKFFALDTFLSGDVCPNCIFFPDIVLID